MTVALSAHKTKIVATIGPASESPDMLTRLIRAGMNVARLNFSHGEFSRHEEVIRRIRDAAVATGRRVAIMADLPGPKMRLGRIDPEPIQLAPGTRFTLTTENIVGNAQRVSVSFEPLPRVVKSGNRLSSTTVSSSSSLSEFRAMMWNAGSWSPANCVPAKVSISRESNLASAPLLSATANA